MHVMIIGAMGETARRGKQGHYELAWTERLHAGEAELLHILPSAGDTTAMKPVCKSKRTLRQLEKKRHCQKAIR